MTANGVYSVLNVPRKVTAFPLWRAIESRWNKNIDGLIRNSSDSSADLLDQLNGQVVPCSGSLDCHWKEDVIIIIIIITIIIIKTNRQKAKGGSLGR